MKDIVLDTCTLKHGSDSDSPYFAFSVALINELYTNSTSCVVDIGFTLDDSNKSYIGLEYMKHLQPGTIGHEIITYLAINERISFVNNTVPQRIKKFIEQKIRNKKDRVFLKVAYNSDEKLLASHDYTDYQIAKRPVIKKEINVSISTAKEIMENL